MSDPTRPFTGEQRIVLTEIDPNATGGLSEQEGTARLEALREELRELHDLMMAAETHALLVVLQGMDAAGKDVTIERVFTAMNPQAFRVKAFSEPSEEEAKHHFLWRADAATPMAGEVVVFDRSYYEQAMPEELQGEVSGEARERRFAHINAFERMLADEGIILVKVFLHIDRDTQEQRLLERQEDLQLAWKLSASDWRKHHQWDEHIAGYESVLNSTATAENPWYVVPAGERWYHSAVVAEIVAARLREHSEAWERERRRIGEENREAAIAAREEAAGGR